MSDRARAWMSLVFLVLALLLPLLGLVLGWWRADLKTGSLLALTIFAVNFLVSALMLVSIQHPQRWMVVLPFLLGVLYNVLPDFLPGGLDDAAVMLLCAFLTYVLALRRQPNMPRTPLIPLVIAGLYPLVGGFIPLPFDELLVFATTGLAAWWGSQPRKG